LRFTLMIRQKSGVGLHAKLYKMKQYIFAIMSLLLITLTVQAQHVNIGIKGGGNAYTIMGDNSADFEPKISFHVGLLGHIHVGNPFALQPEIVYSLQGSQSKVAGVDTHIDLNYVNIPLQLQYMYDNGFRLQAGPQLGILASAKSVTGDSKVDVKANYKSTDIGVTVGMSYVKPSTGFGFDIRYNHGLTNINESDAVNSYNRGIQVGFFFLFQHKS
jgi:Outer membrane protein beta-barrel domain